jgi:hypothetical protein
MRRESPELRDLARIQDVLEWAGVEFIDGDRPGVRMRRARS